MKPIIIYTQEDSPKFIYTLDFIFEEIFNIGFNLIRNPDELGTNSYLTYAINNQLVGPCIPFSGYFSDFNYSSPDFEVELSYTNGAFNFDFLAAIFYLLARVEEYGNGDQRDMHGRYLAQNSILSKHKCLQIPVIDNWLCKLRDVIQREIQIPIPYKRKYSFTSTIDIDHFYAFKHKPNLIGIGGLFRDLLKFDFGKVKDRFATNDPFDRIGDMLQWHEDLSVKPDVFVLTAARSKYDKSLSPDSQKFKKLVSLISKKSNLGIHPSYASEEKGQIGKEKRILESIIGSVITSSRQHYLRFDLPSTYRLLMKEGIKDEYSMGYSEVVGFRAGTSYPFLWYDLENDKKTNLRIIPFQVMDVTLKQYLKLDAREGLQKTMDLIDGIKQVGGNFSLVWHNSSFYKREGWSGWEEVYKRILAYAKTD